MLVKSDLLHFCMGRTYSKTYDKGTEKLVSLHDRCPFIQVHCRCLDVMGKIIGHHSEKVAPDHGVSSHQSVIEHRFYCTYMY